VAEVDGFHILRRTMRAYRASVRRSRKQVEDAYRVIAAIQEQVEITQRAANGTVYLETRHFPT
jgi:hypothetical protein